VWRHSAAVAGRGETASPTDRQHDSDAWRGGCMRGAWSRRGGVEPAAGGSTDSVMVNGDSSCPSSAPSEGSSAV
jgi:hypothetical protein